LEIMAVSVDSLTQKFISRFGSEPSIISHAPGRVEVLGNHTDYNEGLVLSAAIDKGTYFLISPTSGSTITIVSSNYSEEITFSIEEVVIEAQKDKAGTPELKKVDKMWANYIKGVLIGILENSTFLNGGATAFNALFAGDLPLGAGLSSSAALEISSALAFSRLYNVNVSNHDLAKIAQRSEHTYVGVKCGLLDQFSSLYGKEAQLVMSDFRSLDVETVPLGKEACFLIFNTHVHHNLVTSEYNERRESCEAASKFFTEKLSHKVTHLRDVNWKEWEEWNDKMDKRFAKRAAHVIGENERVLQGRELLNKGQLVEFGKLMFQSHESSINNFENSCEELNVIVDIAKNTPEVLGARLSGGGFGGSAVVLVHQKDIEKVKEHVVKSYHEKLGKQCDSAVIVPSSGARIIKG